MDLDQPKNEKSVDARLPLKEATLFFLSLKSEPKERFASPFKCTSSSVP